MVNADTHASNERHTISNSQRSAGQASYSNDLAVDDHNASAG
jgi:hypothetical protein